MSPVINAAQKKIIAKAPSAIVARECIKFELNKSGLHNYIKKRPAGRFFIADLLTRPTDKGLTPMNTSSGRVGGLNRSIVTYGHKDKQAFFNVRRQR